MKHETKNLLAVIIGRSCRRWRLSMDYKSSQIAQETGYSPSLIRYFERGVTNNAVIFLWYQSHGFDIHKDIKTEKGVVIDIDKIFEMG